MNKLKTYRVKQGENSFSPRKPILPFFRKSLDFDVSFNKDWFQSFCQNPDYGLKLYEVGKFNYHKGGCSWAVTWDRKVNGLFIQPYWYEDIKEGVYKLHSESKYRRQLNVDQTYRCCIEFRDETVFYFESRYIFEAPKLPHCWIAPPFLGKGVDNNYPTPMPQAGAIKDLILKIR